MTNHAYRQRLFTELSKVPSETLLSHLIDARRALEGSKIGVVEAMEMITLDLGVEVVIEDDVLHLKPTHGPHTCPECSWNCTCMDQPCSCCKKDK